MDGRRAGKDVGSVCTAITVMPEARRVPREV
jgi:hypothetical protein